MTTRTPIEHTTKLATTVDSLTDAFAFVMEHIDTVGDDPNVSISPVWSRGADQIDDEDPWPRHFSVVVSGMVEDGAL